jgi:hypothetical protein
MVIECVMYLCGGFLIAVLLGLALFPAIHYRAVRLTRRSLDRSAPASLLEMRAEIDCIRAQFATSMCRLEKTVEQLKFTSAIRLSEIEQKTQTINRLKAELARNTAVTDKLARPIEGLVLGTLASIDERANEVAWRKPARRATPVQSADSAARHVIGKSVLETATPRRAFTRFTSQTTCGALDKPVLPLAMVSLAVAGERDDKHEEIEPPPRTIERHHRIGVKNGSLEKPLRPTTDLKKSLLERGQHLNECDIEINALVHELAALSTSSGSSNGL